MQKSKIFFKSPLYLSRVIMHFFFALSSIYLYMFCLQNCAYIAYILLINSIWWTFSYGLEYPLKPDVNSFMISHHSDDIRY